MPAIGGCIKRAVPFFMKKMNQTEPALGGIVKRALPFVSKGLDQSDGNLSDHPLVEEGNELQEELQTAKDSWIASWVPELNPRLWLIISCFWCIIYALPLVALIWRDTNTTQFCYSREFYLTVNIASCAFWVVASTLSAYWYWYTLGMSRALELILSIYFLLELLVIVFIRDDSQPSTWEIIADYGISLVAYIWSTELSIVQLLAISDVAEVKESPIEQPGSSVLTASQCQHAELV